MHFAVGMPGLLQDCQSDSPFILQSMDCWYAWCEINLWGGHCQ